VWPDVADGIQPSNAETIAFQLIVPGLDEELFYRGLLLVALNEAFAGRVNVFGAPIGWGGVATAVLFGVVHGCSWDGGHFDLGVEAMLWAGVPGILLLWLRERTGSLVLPFVAHNLANGLPTLV
ncbi:MAG: CPBP family intramembrane glutamic endopeptidase, partial [Parvularcula sp.]|nr:CPBP family intramembrane glutamic endopeptidase [Parvularcula sp.]